MNPDPVFSCRRTRSLISFAGLLLCATIARSQPSPQAPTVAPLPPVAVTAARTPQPVLDLLADVTVIGPDEIMRSGVQTLAELMQRQPGAEIVQNGGPGSTSGVFLRGANTAQTLVLIDGMRISSSTSGQTALEAIPVSQIDHIEILRGPASSLYGADAIGGVIQVFTRRGTAALNANVSGGYGTYDTSDITGGVSGGAGPARFSVQADARRSTGFNAIVNPLNFSYDPDKDGYKEASVTASGAFTYAPEQELTAQYFRSRLNAQFDGGDSVDDRTITTLQTWQVATQNRFADVWTSRLSGGVSHADSVSETAFGNAPFDTTQRQFAWQNDFTLPLGRLTLALERLEERVATDPPFPVTARNTNSVTGVYQLRAGDQALQANLRVDDSNQYGTHTTGALLYGYRFTPDWRITASYGTAFKPPTFNDLYFPGFSNPNLVPETSHNIEAGVYGRGSAGDSQWSFRTIGWYNRVRDLIVFECDANFNCAPQNVDTANLKGIELGGDVSWNATHIVASIDFQSPRNATSGAQLPRRALRHGALQMTQQIGPLSVGAELVASSLRYDDAADTISMGGYAIVNLTAQWSLARGFSLFVRANNVFNKNYQLAADFSTGGAQVFGGVRWQL